MTVTVTDPADLGLEDAAAALRSRALSSLELVDACLTRIRDRDGAHSHEGDPGSINAWVRVYEDDARGAATGADERLARGDAEALCGIPIGLKDLYAVAGKPLTASSTVLLEVPEQDCDAWERLAAAGMVLLGHLHTRAVIDVAAVTPSTSTRTRSARGPGTTRCRPSCARPRNG